MTIPTDQPVGKTRMRFDSQTQYNTWNNQVDRFIALTNCDKSQKLRMGITGSLFANFQLL